MTTSDGRSDERRAARRASTAATAVTLILALALSGCGIARQVEQAPEPQADVASSVKLALIEEESIDAAAIRVEADEDTVTLSGFVADEEERQRAVQTARTAAGDFTLVDDIAVQP